MSRRLVPVGGQPTVITYEQITEATKCQDCASVLMFRPMGTTPDGHPLFGLFTAHDHTCPAMAAAIKQQQEGSNDE